MSTVARCNDCGTLLKFRDDARLDGAKCKKCGGALRVVSTVDRGDEEPDGDDDSTFLTNLADAVASSAEPTFVRPAGRGRPAASAAAAGSDPAEGAADEQTLLGARPRVRIALLVLMLLPVVFAQKLDLPKRLLACFIPVMLTGTFRTSAIRGDRFKTRFHLVFIPVVSHSCDLRAVTFINVKFGWNGPGAWTFLLFGPVQWAFGWVFEFLMPAIGGPYEIHLVTAKGRELVAWRGFVDSNFKSMLDMLVGLTKAEVRSV